MNINPQVPLFHIVGIFFSLLVWICPVCLWWKRHVEKESGGGWGERERERGKDGEERERGRRVAPSKLIIILNKS